MIICKKCGRQNPDGTQFCEGCKAFLEWMGERAPEPTKAGVKVLIVPTMLAVDPGIVGSYELSVQNTGSVVDSFALQIPDVSWMQVDPPELNLFPGKSAKARIDARPPRDYSVRAGQMRFTVRATSRADPQISAEEMAIVAVGAYMESAARLLPTTSRGIWSGNHTVTVENRGNNPIRGKVEASDPEALLAFDLKPQTFSAAPGESASIQLVATPGGVGTIAQERPHRFQVQVNVDGAAPILLDGTMIQTPAAPVTKPRRRWLLWAIAAVAVLALGGGIAYAATGGFGFGFPGPATQNSPAAVQTPSPSPQAVKTPSQPPVVNADISVAPARLDWSPVAATGDVRIANVANSASAGLAVIVLMQVNGDAAFQIDPTSTCTMNLALTPGQSCQIVVAFRPQQKGPHTATLQVGADGKPAKSMALTFFPSGAAEPGS